MRNQAVFGWILIAAPLLELAMMGLHPSGREAFASQEQLLRVAPLNAWVHGIAIASGLAFLAGCVGLSRRLGLERADVTAALVVFAVAMGAAVVAASLNGFVATSLGQIMFSAVEAADRAQARGLLIYNGLLNQVAVKVHIAAFAGAVVLWSVAIHRTRAFPRWFAWAGGALAAVLLALLFAGLRLDVHGFGLVVAIQAAWGVGAGILLLRDRPVQPLP
jgi:hypothetical protein